MSLSFSSSPSSRAMIGKSLWTWVAVAIVLMHFACAANSQPTNALSDAEIQGRALAQKILEQRPTENYTNTGVLSIKSANGELTKLHIKCEITLSPAGWQNVYEVVRTNEFPAGERLPEREKYIIWHVMNQTNRYGHESDTGDTAETQPSSPHVPGVITPISGSELMRPIAGSDFWVADLGLEFFHWPRQKVLKKEFHRQCACTVLESRRPPAEQGYSRVVCWIDEDSLGIVEAFAYDWGGKKLKNFYPKNLEKVNGQYQVESMVMENLQTGSNSRLDFDLHP
jgi:hypothetical protein